MRPALIVPDEATWTMAGADPAGRRLRPVAGVESAQVLLAPTRVPEPLTSALAAELGRASRQLTVESNGPLELGGRPLRALFGADDAGDRADHAVHAVDVAGNGAPEGGAHGQPGGHGPHDTPGEGAGNGHDDHDMMAIVGEPSADGLVMEPIDLRFGPLSGVLPGGLAVEVSLDGDLVASARVSARLRAGVDSADDVVDPLAPVAWRLAGLVADELRSGTSAPLRVQWQRLAAVEIERALSHAAWLRSLGRLLGWPQLVTTAHAAVSALAPLHGLPVPAGDLREARGRVAATQRLVASRRFSARTRGRGRVDDELLVGPNARGAGGRADARTDDVLYAQLGFAAVQEDAGDARARASARVREAQASLTLAAAALERAAAADGAGVPGAFASAAGARVEGPRGPLVVGAGEASTTRRVVPGAAVTLDAASGAMVGLEWTAALVVLASFDLSPWAVDG
ncbi:hypothetical protein HJD18_02790 [Thermoleophilia bacterium SCSIO 60948]|nr:hypothetical protein HJD18_02790 [Thermoleophilia bacterium SCSIO 60948]